MGRVTALSERREKLTGPTSLKATHDLENFESSQPSLNDWLRNRALAAMEGDTAKTFVVCRGKRRVVGYFSLAAGALEHASATRELKRNAPNPIPVLVLARLAVDKREAGVGLGKALLRDAMKKAVRAASLIGARALVLHALDDQVVGFYRKLGFKRIDPDGRTLFLAMKDIRAGL